MNFEAFISTNDDHDVDGIVLDKIGYDVSGMGILT